MALHFTRAEKEQSLLGLETKGSTTQHRYVAASLPCVKYRAAIWHIVLSSGLLVRKSIVDAVYDGVGVQHSQYAIEGKVGSVNASVELVNSRMELIVTNSTGAAINVNVMLVSNLTLD